MMILTISALLFAVVLSHTPKSVSESVSSYSSSLPAGQYPHISEVDENIIKCRVCLRAIEHMWHRGVIMRDECKHHTRELHTDEQCHLSNLQKDAVDKLVQGTCEALPRSYQAIHTSEFDMVLHDTPSHSGEVSNAIQRVCKRWLHDHHKIETVATILFANLDHGKDTNEILYPLQHRFCEAPCDMAPRKDRKRPSHQKHLNEHHEDYSYVIALNEAKAKVAQEASRSLGERDDEL